MYLVKHIALSSEGCAIHICPHGSDNLLASWEGAGGRAVKGKLVHPDVVGQDDVPIVGNLQKRQDKHLALDHRGGLQGVDPVPMRTTHQRGTNVCIH